MDEDLKKDGLAMELLCAFNGVEVDQAPPDWWYHPNPNIRDCWKRVAKLVLDREEAIEERHHNERLADLERQS